MACRHEGVPLPVGARDMIYSIFYGFLVMIMMYVILDY